VFLRLNRWTPPREDWWPRFNSIEEIYELNRLAAEGSNEEFLAFVEKRNDRTNLIEDKRDMDYLIEIINDTMLSVDPNWGSFSYQYSDGRIFISYYKEDNVRLGFILRARNGDETFDEITERLATSDKRSNITEEIAMFFNPENFDENSIRIGNGVEAFSFYNELGHPSIEEWDDGWQVTLSLDVEGIFITALIDHAPTLEDAFEILANIEFSLGGGWFDGKQ